MIRAVDVSQAFLQPSNLSPEDRVVAIPPNMTHLPWGGKLRPTKRDITQRSRNRVFYYSARYTEEGIRRYAGFGVIRADARAWIHPNEV